jgi:hypothetical protein
MCHLMPFIHRKHSRKTRTRILLEGSDVGRCVERRVQPLYKVIWKSADLRKDFQRTAPTKERGCDNLMSLQLFFNEGKQAKLLTRRTVFVLGNYEYNDGNYQRPTVTQTEERCIHFTMHKILLSLYHKHNSLVSPIQLKKETKSQNTFLGFQSVRVLEQYIQFIIPTKCTLLVKGQC